MIETNFVSKERLLNLLNHPDKNIWNASVMALESFYLGKAGVISKLITAVI